MKAYTAVVIGAGPAGHSCAVRLAELGASVAVVERDFVGGICTNWGCTPSKAMIQAAKIARTVRESARYGVHVQDFRIDFSEIAARRDRVIAASRQHVLRLLQHRQVDLYMGEASLSAPGRVCVRGGKLDPDGERMHYNGEEFEVQADHIVLATGSQPVLPGFVQADNPFIVSSNRLISINGLPERLTIVGGGVIGLEFATIFSNLGSRVTIIEYLDRILAGMDPEISAELERSMAADGVKILTGCQVTQIKGGIVFATRREGGEELAVDGDAILVAVGRRPVIEKDMFDRLGIEYTPKGICVDDYLRTTIPGVWAVGDATGKSILAHVGIQQGIICAENIMQNGGAPAREMSYAVVPAVVYSIPEVVGVGSVPAGLANVAIYKVPFTVNMRARVEGYEEGFLKIWVHEERVLAAQAIGHGVSEIMQELANMIALGTLISAVSQIIHAHPTYSEIARSILEYSMDHEVDFYCDGPEFECSMYRPTEAQLVHA